MRVLLVHNIWPMPPKLKRESGRHKTFSDVNCWLYSSLRTDMSLQDYDGHAKVGGVFSHGRSLCKWLLGLCKFASAILAYAEKTPVTFWRGLSKMTNKVGFHQNHGSLSSINYGSKKCILFAWLGLMELGNINPRKKIEINCSLR